jgi:hypothetical protein
VEVLHHQDHLHHLRLLLHHLLRLLRNRKEKKWIN